MADKKISDFTEALSVDPSDWVEIENTGGNSRKVKAGLLVGVYRLNSSTTSTGTPATTTETDLLSYTMPGGTLANNGSAIRVQAAGTLAGTTRSRTVRFYFGSTVILSGATTTAANVLWRLDATIIRIDGTNQRITGTLYYGPVALNVAATIIASTSTTETLSGSVVVKVTGQSAGSPVANDVVGNFFLVENILA